MSFKKMMPQPYPSRRWSLMGYPGSGKSTFASQMKSDLLLVDAHHRFNEVAGFALGEVYELSDRPADHVSAARIAELLSTNMPNADGVRTIVVDSLTAIISPLVTQAILANDAGTNRNHVAAFKDKAMAMRLLQDAVTKWGTDTLWIYHLRQKLDAKAKQMETTSISPTELDRLRRCLNMMLRIVEDGSKRGVTVEWARTGRYPLTLWDETGCWRGMPERIEEAVYGGLTKAQMDELATSPPTAFRSLEDAIAWGYDQGIFNDPAHARNAYEKVKREAAPKNAAEMWAAWIAAVEARKTLLPDGLEEKWDETLDPDDDLDHYVEAIAEQAAPVAK